MPRIAPLLVFATAITALAIIVPTASAAFVSDNGPTSGPLQLKAGSEPSFTIESKAATQLTLKCATLANGVWKIRKSEASQGEVSKGGHEILSGQFNSCVEMIAGETKTATINAGCELEVVQTGTTTFTGGVAADCSITSGGCVITIAATAANKGLSSVTIVNIETKSDEITSNVSGFTAAPNTKCVTLGLTGNKGLFKAIVIPHGQQVE